MIASDETLEQMQADGKIAPADADAIRAVQSFLTATAGIPIKPEHRTPEQAQQLLAVHREHFPDYWREVDEERECVATAPPPRGECGSCGESPEGECPKSKRPCGHHCNHVWTHDACDWCGKEFGEDPQT